MWCCFAFLHCKCMWTVGIFFWKKYSLKSWGQVKNLVEIFWSKKKKDKKQQGSLEDHQDPRLKVDEQNKQAENKKWRDNKRRNGGAGTNLLISLACSLSCLFCAGFGLKLSVDSLVNCLCQSSLTSFHTLRLPVKVVTPIKAHSLVMNWGRS